MPAIEHVWVTAAGPVTATNATYVDVGATATLTAGRWLVRAICNHTNTVGSGSLTNSSEVELRHNSTRLAVNAWDSIFATFRPSNNTSGSSLKSFAVIDAAANDTVSLWLRSRDTGSGHNNVLATYAELVCINLDDLTEGQDYWYAASSNSDAVDTTAVGTTWSATSATSRIGQGASEVSLTAPTTGDYWVLASVEGFLSAAIGTAEASRFRLRVNGANAGTTVEQLVTHQGGGGSYAAFAPTFAEEDFLSLTENDQPEIQWEVSNITGGDDSNARRARIFVLRLAALDDYAVQIIDGMQVSGANTVESTNGLTFDFGASQPIYITATATWQTGGGNWGRAWLHQDAGDVNHPAEGRIEAYGTGRESIGTGGDISAIAMHSVSTLSGSNTWRLAIATLTGANNHTFARNHANSGDSVARVLAFPLQTAASGSFEALSSSVATVSGSLIGVGDFTGAGASGLATVSGTLIGVGVLGGSANGLTTASALMAGRGMLAGSAVCNALVLWLDVTNRAIAAKAFYSEDSVYTVRTGGGF